MRRASRKYLLSVTSIILAVLAVVMFPINGATEATEHVIDLNASQFAFTPGRIEVNQGDTIIFNLRATDVVHGLYLDGYGIDRRVIPGVTDQIEVTADQVGKFHYRCSVSCGALHPFMVGELIVRPNSPFWKSILMTLIALGGFLMLQWQTTQKRINDVQQIEKNTTYSQS